MSDQEEDKKILNDDPNQSGSENQSEIEDKNQPEGVQNLDNEKIQSENENIDQNTDETKVSDASVEKKDENEGSTHQVIHKKDGRLHIYVRQDKYKGELKSKNWVGRLYIDGKQKISSSGTTNLDEAIPILEKWFDDVQAESEKLKKQSEETKNRSTFNFQNISQIINIEKSLKVGDEISGHFVYGHVDCITKISKIEKLDSSWVFEFEIVN